MNPICAAAVLLGLTTTLCYADVNGGLAAYKAGDYAKALRGLQPAAAAQWQLEYTAGQ